MHVHNKNSNIQVRSLNVVYHKELLLKERICSLRERFFEVPILKKEANEENLC